MIRTSLKAKLVRTMVATLILVAAATLVIVAGMNVVSSRRTLQTIEDHLRAGIEEKGRGLVMSQALVVRDLVTAQAFGQVARLLARTVDQDKELVYGWFIDRDDKLWGFASNKTIQGFPSDGHGLGIDPKSIQKPGVTINRQMVAGQSLFAFANPVEDDQGRRLGTLGYALSDRPLRQALAGARADSVRTLTLTLGLLSVFACLTLGLGIGLARRSAAQITQPVSDLTAAVKTLANGQRDIRVAIATGDELEGLGNTFNHLAGELHESYAKIEMLNRTLEQKVEERTKELGRRNRDMRLVLDNVNQGFLTLSATGVLAVERSTIIDRWFGPFGAGIQYVDYMNQVDALYALGFGVGLEALNDNFLPLEVCLDQLPARLRRDGKEYRCRYTPILRGEKFDGLLIVISDVTAELLHARQEAERKEILAMFEALAKDRAGFLSFMDEANELMGQVATANLEGQKRILHTLKGNAGLVGFAIVAQLCHQIEDELGEQTLPLTANLLSPVIDRWNMLSTSLKSVMGDKGREVIELTAHEINRLEDLIRSGAPSLRLLDRLASWWLEPSELPMRRLGRYASALSIRLGKGDLNLVVRSNGIRLAPKAWSGLWTDLVHVIRNAVDHGLETPTDREAIGKPRQGTIRFVTAIENGHRLVIEIGDDGRGVDWNGVREAASKKGLPHASQDDLVKALFTTGVSTRTEVTTLSGRGVGLSAVRQQVEALGGTLAIDTQANQGTTFRFVFTLPGISPRYGIDVETDA